MIRHSILFKVANALLLLSLLGGCDERSSRKNKSSKNEGIVERTDLLQQVTIAGNIAPVRTTNIAAPYTGYVKKLYVAIGDKIKIGAPIVSVAQSLLSQQPVFPMQSPLEGIVVQINKLEGEFVRGDDNRDFILRIDDTSGFVIKAETPEIDRIKVKVGQKAIVKVNAIIGKTYDGVIRSIARAPTVKDSWRSSTVEYSTIVEILNPDAAIHSGMTALVDLIVAKREKVLTLRHEYIQKDKQGYFVIRGTGERQDIGVGLQNEEAFEITSGLKEGDKIKIVDFASLVEAQH